MTKLRALSRVLTEIMFIITALSAAIGVFATYNNYTADNNQIHKLACTDVVIVSAAKQVYVTVKNIGTSRLNTTISSITESEGGKNLLLYQIEYAIIEPGIQQLLKAKVDNVTEGARYIVIIVGKIKEDIVTYQIIETTAMP